MKKSFITKWDVQKLFEVIQIKFDTVSVLASGISMSDRS